MKYLLLKTKYRSNIASVLLMFFVLVFTISCNKEDNQPIRLDSDIYNDKPNFVLNNQVTLLFPTAEKIHFRIIGGDGNFAVTNSNEKIITVSINERVIDIIPLNEGSSVVTITDKSGNSYIFNVKIAYRQYNMMIEKQDIIVVGEKLSEVQKAEIKQEAILTLPVKINGGFKLVYNKGVESKQGQAFIYKESYGVGAIESIFEEKRMEIEVNGFKKAYPVFTITIDGTPRDFILTQYITPNSKSIGMVPMALNEILTDRFKTQYPDLKMVYTQQGFKIK